MVVIFVFVFMRYLRRFRFHAVLSSYGGCVGCFRFRFHAVLWYMWWLWWLFSFLFSLGAAVVVFIFIYMGSLGQ